MSRKNCAGSDAFLRMNYLYQLSNTCALGKIPGAENLAHFYAQQVTAIAKKSVQRISPDIKRRICKTCHEYQIPGKTCKIRIRKKVVIHKCLVCARQKRFETNLDYQLWIHNPEAVIDTIVIPTSDE